MTVWSLKLRFMKLTMWSLKPTMWRNYFYYLWCHLFILLRLPICEVVLCFFFLICPVNTQLPSPFHTHILSFSHTHTHTHCSPFLSFTHTQAHTHTHPPFWTVFNVCIFLLRDFSDSGANSSSSSVYLVPGSDMWRSSAANVFNISERAVH